MGGLFRDFEAPYDSEFAVIISVNGCADTSDCYFVNVDALGELAELQFDIYPNPSAGRVQIIRPNQEKVEVVVTDICGKTVYSDRLLSDKLEFSHFVPGLYVLTLTNAYGRHSERLIIRR